MEEKGSGGAKGDYPAHQTNSLVHLGLYSVPLFGELVLVPMPHVKHYNLIHLASCRTGLFTFSRIRMSSSIKNLIRTLLGK